MYGLTPFQKLNLLAFHSYLFSSQDVNLALQCHKKILWHDNRDGDTNDGGDIQAQFAMSEKGWRDYNNCTQANGVQIYNPYGNDPGTT